MYAIVEIAGQQFKVEQDKFVYTHRLEGEEGDTLTLENVLLVDNGADVRVGTPKVEGATITAKIEEHLRGDKVLVFKKKRRKGYKKSRGHRQHLTKVMIESINA